MTTKTIEGRIRELVALTTEIPRKFVYVAPLLATRPEDLHAVIDVPAQRPMGQGPLDQGYNEETEEQWAAVRWSGVVRVRFQGPGHSSAARALYGQLMLGAIQVVERQWHIGLELMKYQLVPTDELRGDDTVGVSEVQCEVQWNETYSTPTGHWLAASIGIDHDGEPEPIRETIAA